MTGTSQYNQCPFCGLTMGEHEHSCPLSDETVNYHVWKVEDGHPWKESQWPSLRDVGQCDLCTAPEHLHIQGSHD